MAKAELIRPQYVETGPIVNDNTISDALARYRKKWEQDRQSNWKIIWDTKTWRPFFRQLFEWAAPMLDVEADLGTIECLATKYPRGVSRGMHTDLEPKPSYPKLIAILSLTDGCRTGINMIGRDYELYVPIRCALVLPSYVPHWVPKGDVRTIKVVGMAMGPPWR